MTLLSLFGGDLPTVIPSVTEVYGSLSLTQRFPARYQVRRRAVQTQADTGQVQRRQTFTAATRNFSTAPRRREVKSWVVSYGPLSRTDFTTLLTAYEGAAAAALPILWEPPPPHNGSQIPVRFSSDELRVQRAPGDVYHVEVGFEEVI